MNQLQKDQIKRLRQEGYGYSRIAQMLGISVNTIKSYCQRNNLGGKLGILAVDRLIDQVFCKFCGRSLTQIPGCKPRKFCSDGCRMAWWKAHPKQIKKKTFYRITCVHCGKEFDSYGNKGRKYCSHPCYISERFGDAKESERL